MPFTIVKRILLILIVLWSSPELIGQYQQIYIGAGLSPVHRSVQSDFSPSLMPYDIFVMYQRDNYGVRLDYNWNPLYIKENFSFTHDQIELSLTYSVSTLLGLSKVNPYVRAGATKWRTDFTTEGYPGIVDYQFKVEQDQGYGVIGAIGASYPYRQFAFGIEGQFSKNGNSQFIAGGFESRPLSSDHYRLMVYAQYKLPIHLKSKNGVRIDCPSF